MPTHVTNVTDGPTIRNVTDGPTIRNETDRPTIFVRAGEGARKEVRLGMLAHLKE